MRVIALYRVSSTVQEEEGTSLAAQQRRYHELAAIHGWTTVGEFRGVESATQAASERTVLQEVLSCVRECSPHAIWVIEQSRLTRADPLEVALLFRELAERDVKVIVGSDVRDLSSVDGRFIVGIQSLVDRAEAERLRERSLRGKRERAWQGKKNCGGAPFGYRNPLPGDPQRGTLQIVPDQAAVVRRIFEMAASGVSTHEIVRQLNARLEKGPKGKPWRQSTVRLMLKNPVYIGTHVSNAWVAPKGTRKYVFDLNNPDVILVPGAHEPIVSREAWDTVQTRPKPACSFRPHMLTGLLHINGFPSAVQYAHATPFYHCRDHSLRRQPWLGLDETDNAVWKAFVSVATDPKVVESIIAQAEHEGQADGLKAEMERCEKLISKLQARMSRLVDMRADGEITKELYMLKHSQTAKELRAAKERQREVQTRMMCADRSQAERAVKAVQALIGGHRKLDTKQKRRLLHSIARRVDVNVAGSSGLSLRGRHGRFKSGWGRTWRIRDATFHLAVNNGSDRDCELNKSSRYRCRRRFRRWLDWSATRTAMRHR